MAHAESEIQRQYFPRHKALYDPLGPEFERLEWSNPMEGGNRVVFVRDGDHLFVGGDLGTCVLTWGRACDLAFMARCDLAYFQSRVTARESWRELHEVADQERLVYGALRLALLQVKPEAFDVE